MACCHTGTTVTPGAEVFQNQIMDISNQSLSAYATRRADDDNLDDIVRLSLALESASVRTREEVDESSVQQYHRYRVQYGIQVLASLKNTRVPGYFCVPVVYLIPVCTVWWQNAMYKMGKRDLSLFPGKLQI